MSNPRFRSILEELSDNEPRNRDLFIESRAQQVLASVSHLMKLISESYDEELAEDLKKRLLSSMKNEDESKFRRKMKQIRESKK